MNFAGWPFGLPFWPLHALFGAVGAWNAFLLLGYVGAGGLAFLWLRSMGLGLVPAAVGGLAFALAPYRTAQAGAGHLLAWTAMLLPLSLWGWERRLYVVSASALASIPLSGQVHLALGAIPFFLLYALLRDGRRAWAAVTAGGAVLSGLLVWAVSIRGSIGEGRDFGEVERYSAELADFFARDPRHGLEPFVFLGWAVPLLALAGVVLLRDRLALVLAASAVVPAALALGANLPGYELVWDNLPALGSTRVPGRLMPIACLAIAALAAFAVARIRWPIAGALALALVLVDLTYNVFPVHPTPADEANGAYAAGRDTRPGRLLELPIQPPDRQEASVYRYYAMQAPREGPAGYSTVAPARAARTLRRLAPCPSGRELDLLGVRLVAVVGSSRCPPTGRLLARDGPVAMYER